MDSCENSTIVLIEQLSLLDTSKWNTNRTGKLEIQEKA